MSASVPAPPVVASVPGAQFEPFHLSTLPVAGVTLSVSTSLKKSIPNAAILIVKLLVSVVISVSMFVPPSTLSVAVAVDAVDDPSSDATVSNKFCVVPPSTVLVIVNVLPVRLVLTPVPPATINVSLIVSGVTEPVSALNVVKIFLSNGCIFQTTPSNSQVVPLDVYVSFASGLAGKFNAISLTSMFYIFM